MRIVITGASGYLGSRLATMFRQSGHTVLALKRFATELPPADAVVHTACCYGRAQESRHQIFGSNVYWATRILDTLRPGTLFLNADTVLPAKLNSYAESKDLFRQTGSALSKVKSVRWVNLRLEHFFGPGEGDEKFVTRTVRACLEGGELKLTPGEQCRDFIFIEDVVRAFENAFRVATERREVRELYVGSGRPVRIREMVERIHRLCGMRGTLHFGAIPYRDGEPMEIGRPRIEPLESYGWRPSVDLDDGLERVVQFEKARKADPCVCS